MSKGLEQTFLKGLYTWTASMQQMLQHLLVSQQCKSKQWEGTPYPPGWPLSKTKGNCVSEDVENPCALLVGMVILLVVKLCSRYEMYGDSSKNWKQEYCIVSKSSSWYVSWKNWEEDLKEIFVQACSQEPLFTEAKRYQWPRCPQGWMDKGTVL